MLYGMLCRVLIAVLYVRNSSLAIGLLLTDLRGVRSCFDIIKILFDLRLHYTMGF